MRVHRRTLQSSIDAQPGSPSALLAPSCRVATRCYGALSADWLGAEPARHAGAAPAHADRSARKGAHRVGPRTLASLPPIVAARHLARAAPSDVGALVATFTPAGPGQQVTLERRTRRRLEGRRHGPRGRLGLRRLLARRRHLPRPHHRRAAAPGSPAPSPPPRWTPEFEDTFSGTDARHRRSGTTRSASTRACTPRAPARASTPPPAASASGVLHLGVACDPARPDAVLLHDARGSRHQPLHAQQPGRHRAHPLLPARHRRRPHQAPAGQGHALRLLAAAQPARSTSTASPAGGTEIDVMEFFGENGRGTETIGSHVHYYEAGWQKVSLGDIFPAARRVAGRAARSWWDEFHVFSVEWTPQEYVFRIDGREYYRETKAVSQVPQYLVLSNLTSDYELAELTAGRVGDTAQVDWVRVFDATSQLSARVTRGRRTARLTGHRGDLGSPHAPHACPRAAARRRRARRRTPRLAGAARRRPALPARPPRHHQQPAPHGGGGSGARARRTRSGRCELVAPAAAGRGAAVGDRAARRRTGLARPPRRRARRRSSGRCSTCARRRGRTCSTPAGCRTSRWRRRISRADVPAALDVLGHDGRPC